MSNGISVEDLAKLFMETGKHHHKAYEASDGVDPEWALFYAGYFQTKIWDRLGDIPTRSRIIHFLLDADKQFQATDKEYMEWPAYYAKLYLEKNARD